MNYSIIIPTLNEESSIKETLRHIPHQCELIIVDGGSTDNTLKLIKPYKNIILIKSKNASRAIQMNLGAKKASKEVLIFLHADTLLKKRHIQEINSELKKDKKLIAGAFRIKFTGKHPLLKANQLSVILRSLLFGVFYGDQAIFIKRKVFQKIGGYKKIPILEDGDISRRLKKEGKIKLLKNYITTSSRRIEESGIIKTLSIYATITTLFILKTSPETLKKIYRKIK